MCEEQALLELLNAVKCVADITLLNAVVVF